jgi:hypothetical protein
MAARKAARFKFSDGAVLCVTVSLMGAQSVLGEHISHFVGLWLFYGGLVCLLAFATYRAWQVSRGEPYEAPEGITNVRSAYAGRDNIGSQTIYNAPVTINAPVSNSAQEALEIVFDETNPHKRFWSRILIKHPLEDTPSNYADEYRVLIINNSDKTVRNVNVSRESTGLIPTLAEDTLFNKNGKALRDIDPGRSELVNIFWVMPPRAGDAWGRTATAFHGPIKIIASGTDVRPAECEFDYHPDDLPALVRRR